MSEVPFHKTRIGQEVLIRDISRGLDDLRLLRKAAERIAAALEKSAGIEPSTKAKEEPS